MKDAIQFVLGFAVFIGGVIAIAAAAALVFGMIDALK